MSGSGPEPVDEPGLHVRLQDGGQHEQAPDAVDDAGDGSQQLDRDPDRALEPHRGELGEEDGDAEAHRDRQQQRQEGGDERAVHRRERTVLVGDRVPDLAGEEAELEVRQRRPGAGQQRERDAAQQQQHEERGHQRRAAEQALAQALPDGVARLDRCHGVHRGRQPVTACNPRTRKPAAAPVTGKQPPVSKSAQRRRLPVLRRAMPSAWSYICFASEALATLTPLICDFQVARTCSIRRCRQRHVVQFGGHLATVLVGPVKELERRCRRDRIRRCRCTSG